MRLQRRSESFKYDDHNVKMRFSALNKVFSGLFNDFTKNKMFTKLPNMFDNE